MNLHSDDELYRDLIEGELTESADGGEAMWDIMLILTAIPIIVVFRIVRWIYVRLRR